MTQNYELLYIIPIKYSESEIKSIAEKIDKWLLEKNCQILKSENFGERKLAYQIKQVRYGHYILRELATEKENVKEINNYLTLAEEVLRHLIVKIEPVKKAWAIRTKITKKAPEPNKEKPTDEEVSEKDKITLDNLDQKLDEILQEKIV